MKIPKIYIVILLSIIMKAMKKLFIILLVFVFNWGTIPVAYGDNIPTNGKWGKREYRSVVFSPPILFLEGNVLSIYFENSIRDLTVRLIDSKGRTVYENVVSGGKDEILDIVLEEEGAGSYQVVLEHSVGRLVGEFKL